MQTIEQLKQQFGIADRLDFSIGPAESVMIDIDTPCAKAQIAMQGAQVLAYQPANAAQDLLFLSPLSRYGDRRAIRGGVPICWPWFGDDPSGTGRLHMALPETVYGSLSRFSKKRMTALC